MQNAKAHGRRYTKAIRVKGGEAPSEIIRTLF